MKRTKKLKITEKKQIYIQTEEDLEEDCSLRVKAWGDVSAFLN